MSKLFYDRLRADFPSQVVIDLTEVCNLACVHCPHPDFKKSELYHATMLDPALNQKAVDEVAQHGADYIRYTSNGEPLVHPQCYDMIQYAVDKSGTFVTLTTNGVTMNQKRMDKLLATGLHMVDISLDAYTIETYAKIRKGTPKQFRQAYDNVLSLCEASKGKITKVIVSFIVHKENEHELEQFTRYWRSAGAIVVPRRLHSAAGFVSVDQLKNTIPSKRYPCLYPWERITLAPDGELHFCPQDWVHGSKIADYRDTTIYETWNSDFYKKLRQAHETNDFSCHKFCGKCPDWQQTRWPEGAPEGLAVGRSYANLVKELK